MKKQRILQLFVNTVVVLGFVFATLVFLMPGTAEAFANYFSTIYVRNAIVDYGTLTVTGTATFNGSTNLNGGIASNLNGTVVDTGRFIADKAVGRARFTVGSTAGTGAGKLYAGDSIYVASTLFADANRNVAVGTITGTKFISDVADGRARATVGTSAGTGAGKLYAGDSIYVATSLFADANRNLSVGKVTGSYAISDVADGRPRFTVGTSAGTGLGKTYLDSIYVGTTLFCDDSRNLTAGTYNGQTVSSAASLTGTLSVSGKTTFGENGTNYTLHTIAAGDSVFLHEIVDAADTTLKVWNGSAWVTVKDLIP